MASKKSNTSIKNTPVIDNDNNTSSEGSSDDEPVVKTKPTLDKKVKLAKVEPIDDDSEEINNKSESESESETDSDSNQNKKSKEKKPKESFDVLTKKLDELQHNIKSLDKEISDEEKLIKTKVKSRNDYERQRNSILKILSKTHNDEILKARKEKPKRKGNVNGGFCKEQPVPDLLIKFIGLEQGVIMKRPQVMSVLSNKLTELKLKKGQDTILDKAAVKALELDKSYEGKVIKFGEFQTFLKSFYPVKEEKNSVVM